MCFTLTEIKDSLNDYYDGQLDIDLQLNITQQKLIQIRKQQTTISLMIEMLTERIDILEHMKSDSGYKLDIDVCKKTLPLS